MGAEALVNPLEVGSPTLEVVLATYNGADCLEQQLQSLLQQWKQPDRLIVQDDGSTDGTAAILLDWSERHPNWIRQLPPSAQRRGPKTMFSTLLSATTAPYVALSDQGWGKRLLRC
jgi:glycosyltransferase involved in cell wall biosynthesis